MMSRSASATSEAVRTALANPFEMSAQDREAALLRVREHVDARMLEQASDDATCLELLLALAAAEIHVRGEAATLSDRVAPARLWKRLPVGRSELVRLALAAERCR